MSAFVCFVPLQQPVHNLLPVFYRLGTAVVVYVCVVEHAASSSPVAGCSPRVSAVLRIPVLLQWSVLALALVAITLLAGSSAEAAPQSRRFLEQTGSARRTLLVRKACAFMMLLPKTTTCKAITCSTTMGYSLPLKFRDAFCRLVVTAPPLYTAMAMDTALLLPPLFSVRSCSGSTHQPFGLPFFSLLWFRVIAAKLYSLTTFDGA